MKRLLIPLLVLLSACAPSLSGGTSGDADGATLTLERKGDVVEIVLAAGPRDAITPALTVGGISTLPVVVAPAGLKCTADGLQLACGLPTIRADESYTVTVRGPSVFANALLKRAGRFGAVGPIIGAPKPSATR